MSLYCELEDVKTESDVEQKFIYPFLNSVPPMGLGFADSEILTKNLLRKALIDKGQKKHYYYPDYVVSLRGLPVLVVEAKAPSEKLADGFAEARLYAHELNDSFSHGFNTCSYVIATNCKELWLGYVDQAEPLMKLSFSDFNIQGISYCKCTELVNKKVLTESINRLFKQKRGDTKYTSPVGKLGGKRVQNSEMEENAFGRILVFENRGIFDPNTESERKTIVENAYISSAKREQHMDPIYKEIKRFAFPSTDNYTQIATDEPNELVERIKENIMENAQEYSLMLIIGNVGSGKTTFTRYFRHVYLKNKHYELAGRCEWIFLNMNHAPVIKEEIYDWIKKSIISSIKEAYSEFGLDELETIKKIFRKEIAEFEKGLGKLIVSNTDLFNIELYKLLQKNMADKDKYLSALIRFIKEYFSKIPIIVLDNCDKRDKNDQLLMFEVAQWLRSRFRCIVLLPMRDTTYDQYKTEPPLDTVVRDLVFRIDPPDLLKVLQARLDYLVRITDIQSNAYVLRNGIQVSVKRTELNDYFKSILVAIRKDRWISDIFYRLTNRNIRNGIQIFEDFCKSGHLAPEDIFEMRALEEDAEIPTYKFENVLIRKNRRYYNSAESNFISLFSSDFNDDYPDPFVRLDILWWLQSMNKKVGPNKEKGVFPISDLIRNLQMFGHSSNVIIRELDYMIQKELIVCDNIGEIDERDMVKIAMPGNIHMQMLKHISYLGACAEDFLFKNTDTLTRITNRLRQLESDPYLIEILNAKDLLEYLVDYKEQYSIVDSFVISEGDLIESYDIKELLNIVKTYIHNTPGIEESIKRQEELYAGKLTSCRVISKKDKGIVCLIGLEECKGFLSVYEDRYKLTLEDYNSIKVDDIIQCAVIDYDFKHKSFQLRYIAKQNDVGEKDEVC